MNKTVRYICHRTEDAIDVDGHLREEAWSRAPRSPRFGDHTGQRSLFDTRAAMLWDDEYLYVGFWLEDRDVCGAQGEDPLSVRQDNNAGVLLIGRGAYYELAVNPLGATSEMFHIWKEALSARRPLRRAGVRFGGASARSLGRGIEFRLSRHALGFFALALSRITGWGAGRGHSE